MAQQLVHGAPIDGVDELDRRGSIPACSSPARSSPAIARLEWIASEPPRRMTALPALRQSAAATSAVTLGRDS
jgi:hypothetical protein